MAKYCDIDTLDVMAFDGKPLDFLYGAIAVLETLDKLPAADVAEVRHGHWDDSKVAFHRVCSKCGAVVRQDVSLVYLLECMEKVGALNYCPNCGAKMDEVTE